MSRSGLDVCDTKVKHTVTAEGRRIHTEVYQGVQQKFTRMSNMGIGPMLSFWVANPNPGKSVTKSPRQVYKGEICRKNACLLQWFHQC